MSRGAIFAPCVLGLATLLVAVGGCSARPPASSQGATSASPSNPLVAEVRSRITNEAYSLPDTATLDQATTVPQLLGLLHDRYTEYLDPAQAKLFEETSSGSYGGIGVTLGKDPEGRVTVAQIYKGTPAARAGLKAGDVFQSIDATTQPHWTTDGVIALVRGPVGSDVTLTMLRGGSPVTVKVTRAQVEVPAVEHRMLGNATGYIRITQLSDTAAEDVRTAIADLASKGAKRLVIDVRDNSGGPLQNAVDVASVFLGGGTVYQQQARGGSSQSIATSGQQATAVPIVLLVNGATSSGAEIIAGALKDAKRAVLIGTKTYGDGSVQTVDTLSNGGSVKLTTAKILTPSGNAIDGVGVSPDVVVAMDPSLESPGGSDAQLQAAIATIGK